MTFCPISPSINSYNKSVYLLFHPITTSGINPLTVTKFTVFGHSLSVDTVSQKSTWVAALLGTPFGGQISMSDISDS